MSSATAHACDGEWELIWGWKGPHRIQMFAWLATHGRLLTNVRRHKWNATFDPTCPCCRIQEESLIHVLCDCTFATQIWQRILPSNQVVSFFSQNCKDWLFNNFNNNYCGTIDVPWNTTFMVTIWSLWKWRNQCIFEEGFIRPTNPLYPIFSMAKEITNLSKLPNNVVRSNIHTVHISWLPPTYGWIKLNCDGASKSQSEMAGCGGLFRDPNGQWISGFVRKLGNCNALQAEMWGMLEGIRIARQHGFTKLTIESDSKMVVDMVNNRNTSRGSHTLIRRIQRVLQHNWEVQVTHVWREGNRCADWLANHSLTLSSFEVQVLQSPPRELQRLLFDDYRGTTMPRSVGLAS